MSSPKVIILQVLVTISSFLTLLCQAGRVTQVAPVTGSLLGATRLTITGEGFAADQFNYYQTELGNNVTLVSVSRAHVIPCDVIPYYTTPYQIVCDTRASPSGEDTFNFRVLVDGKLLDNTNGDAYCGSECEFKYSKERTPTIESLTPRYGLPGTLLTIRGRLFTAKVIETEELDPEKPIIERIFAGAGICDVKNPETEELYGIAIEDKNSGYIKCKPSSSLIDSQWASFLVSDYGRSQMSKDSLLVDAEDKLYLFQTHADISDVRPTVGSVAGGTFLTINGHFFEKNPKKLSVDVGGVPCKVLSSDKDVITCQTGEAPPRFPHADDAYPGARGMLREVWTNTKPSSVSAVGNLKPTAQDYQSEAIPEASAATGESTSFSSRLRGFFVPPSDNNYTFFIQADDIAELYLSLSSSAVAKFKVASCSSPTTSWSAFPEQRSAVFFLKRGQPYYIEALQLQEGGKSHLIIGVKVQKTRYVNSQVGSAVNEKQEIRISSETHPEKQIVNVSSWYDGRMLEVQEVEVTPCHQEGNATVCGDVFALSYNGMDTALLSLRNLTTANLEVALNNLTAIRNQGHVKVTEIKKQNCTVYRVTFHFVNPENTQMLRNKSSNEVYVRIQCVTRGVNGNYWFKLSLAGRTSGDIHMNGSASDVKHQLEQVIGWQCNYQTPPERAYYYNGFESPPQDPEWGERVLVTKPYCGRTSIKNARHIFVGGRTKDLWGRVLKGYDVSRYKQLCFSYKGMYKDYLNFQISYTDKYSAGQRTWRKYSFVLIRDNQWHQQCMNVEDQILSDSYLNSKADARFKFYVESISAAWDSGTDAYMDDIFVWRDNVLVQRVSPAAEPNGHIIESVDVQSLGPSTWAVSLKPASCGTGIQLLEIANAEVVGGNTSSNRAVFRSVNATGNFTIIISREHPATPPIGGTFKISFEDEHLEGVPASISADDLKSVLENNFNIGKVSVSRTGRCASYNWTVTWATTGGDQPTLIASGTGLTGNKVSITALTIEDGGLFLRPIPGDMLRMAESNPQVVVTFNNIPSSCSKRNCSFTFSPSATAFLTSVSPQRGKSGTEITLTGSGFSLISQEVNVNIGGVACNVTSTTLTTIKCTAGQSIGGVNEIVVRVDGKGLAKHSSGEVTFTYLITVSHVTPGSGSIGGGTLVTIKGNGFGVTKNDSTVTMGGSACVIRNTCATEIVCVTSRHGPSIVGVDVAVTGEIGSLSNGYRYDNAMTPTVSFLSVLEGSVGGGEELVIRGRGFGLSRGTIKIGSNPCKVVSYYDVFIKCTTPANPPGIYDVLIIAKGKGYAVLGSRPPQFEYVLKVTDIYPRHGSMFGGTIITVTGRGFSDNTSSTVVNIGSVPCEIVSSRNTVIKCKTAASSVTHVVDNSGIHPEFGLGYAWSPQTVAINIGDYVQWKWISPELSGLTFGIQQTRDAISTAYDGKGLKSARSGSGTFIKRFEVPGTYYYSSGEVDPYGAIVMRGQIVVKDLKSLLFDIEVQVGEIVALHNSSSRKPSNSGSSDCQTGSTTPISQCSAVHPLPDNLLSSGFTFWKCSTPEVTSISPNIGTSSTILTIKGKGFGLLNCQNEVRIGSRGCFVQTSSEDTITCLVTPGLQLSSGLPYDISLRVHNRGFAVIKIPDRANATFTLQPTIQSVTPQAGSVMGGSIITITGDGFSSISDSHILIGETPCFIVSASYTQIRCQTNAKNSSPPRPVVVIVNGMKSQCSSTMGCLFSFLTELTPTVDSVTPSAVVGADNTISIYGSGLPSESSDLIVTIGNTSCVVTSSSQYSAKCRVDAMVAGKHKVRIWVASKGFALFEAGASGVIESVAIVSSIAPTEGSVMGGTELSIKGSGFDSTVGHTSVKVGNNYCSIVRVTSSEVVCKTTVHSPGSFEVMVTVNGQEFPRLRYAYRTFTTPYVESISPSWGEGGQTITIFGSGFSTVAADTHVIIANTSCSVLTSSSAIVTCVLGHHAAGLYDVILHVKGKGLAGYSLSKPVKFVYEISLTSVSPNESGLGGGRVARLKGRGFDSTTVVKICENVCVTLNGTLFELFCEVPAYVGITESDDITCPVSVTAGNSGVVAKQPGFFTYRESLTSRITSVNPTRGGTGGGVDLTIKGSGFSSLENQNKVTIGDVPCKISFFSSIEINCTTGSRKGTIHTKVRVEVGDQGIATQVHAHFQYIDLWSSPFSWGGKRPPVEGDLVIIPNGQTMLLDMDTPVFAVLVIRGELIFDEKDLTLNAKRILVVDGGKLEVGTESKPFQHKAKIVLHGHQLDTRLPIFGTKVLAVREGTLDLHGKFIPITWTHLAQTAMPGETQLILKHSVTWTIGDLVVLASTSRSPQENEELNITSVSNGGRIIGVTPPLKYKHISVVQKIAGRTVKTRAEVGLLSRNVVVEGSENDEWKEKIEECQEGFNPGQFAVHTCFQGRYGDTMGSEQFGSQIMINARMKSEGLVTGRISYVEVRKAGQAFGLGRYPIHFHLSGDVTGSYVRGCAIHHTFNRAVTVHGVTGVLVEHNVAYNVMGHAFFIEDGIETGNTIQYNLGVFIKTSSSLLITDVTPAAFWVTNPNNTVRHNAAAGGSHHGYWYNLPTHPGGPSFTTAVCPKNAPLGEFQNNTAHSFGRYGVWIFQDYFPMSGGICGSTTSEPAKFYNLLAYNNLKGFELTNGGAIQTINFTVLDNKEAGLEFTKLDAAPWDHRGPLVKDSLLVGHSVVSGDSSACTQGGLVAPHSSRLTVSGTTFVNFDVLSCAALRACSFCKLREGGFTTKFEKTQFINSPNKAAFKWEHEGVFEDLDGTLTGFAGGGSILPSNANLPPQHCYQSPTVSLGQVSGSVCDANVRFRRMAWNKPLPTSLLYRDALLTNEHGTSRIPWRFMRLTHNQGWMATVILGQNYNFTFDNAPQLTNISYSATFYEFGEQDFLWITHPMKQVPDIMSTTSSFVNMTCGIPSPENASNGDWFFNNRTKELSYIVSGRGGSGVSSRNVQLQVYRCFFKNCIKPIPPPPPEKRPIEYLRWSDPESWYGTEPGYGGHNKQLPKDGDDVMILQHWWMVADAELPWMRKLLIYGTMELEPHMDFVLNATYIVVGQGGNLIIGWESQPMVGSVLISLSGNWDTPDLPIQDGPNLGSKAIGVFGNLEIHGLNRSVYWTRLSKTADPGSSIIYLETAVDWRPGEEIVIAPTAFEPYDTEIFNIVNVFPGGKTLQLNGTLRFKHIAESYRTGTWNYTLAAEVGLLTRNIVIEGADDADQVLDKQSFGCRTLIGSFGGKEKPFSRRVRVENVEFRHCGQEGWSDEFDPRYSLALLDVGTLKSSYIRGNSFHNGFNTAIGAFGTNELIIMDNVVHHTVGSSVRVSGTSNKLLRNLIVLSVSPATYKGRHEDQNQLWHAAFDVSKAYNINMRDNAAAGSERIGFHIRGKACYQGNSEEPWEGNIAHTTLHGIHIGYGDGLPGCLKIDNFLIWKSWDYGVFGFPTSRVIIQNTVVADSNIGVLVNVWSPPALSHKTADKFVRLNNVLIVGTSPSFDCATDLIVPRNSDITKMVRAPRYEGGGNTGFMLTTFCSAPGLAPEKPWHEVISYPAVRGVVKLNNVGFAHFGRKCGKSSVVFTTNPGSPDAFHPMMIRRLSRYSVDNDKLFYIPPSNIAWINPSDCVDMDCDGAKHVLVKDLDGTLTGAPGGGVISKAEYEWNGDPRRGLGDYRLPKAMLTSPDGSRLNASVVAPHHGIARGTEAQSFCSWNAAWNAYRCSSLDYHMLVLESLDADTELRRLSPVAVSTNGYTDLLNGPMDQGCCFGYSCMERISTFHSIVAVDNNYTIYFTGTNPENFRLTLLNANSSKVLRVAIRYATPRRLDVYRKGVYVYPTNAKLDEQNFSYKKKNPNLPDDQFEPQLTSISGANYFARESQTLFVVVRGSVGLDIRTAPVVQVQLGSRPVHFNDFFEKNLIHNLASLLQIDESRIRIVEVVNALESSRRRRRKSNDGTMNIKIEIGNPPQPQIPYTPEGKFNPGNSSSTTASPVTLATTPVPTSSPTDEYIALQSVAAKAVEAAQTGSMASVLDLDILSIEVTDPEPPRKLPEGWKRATPADAGAKNGTWRFDEVEMMKERNKSSPVHDYLIPVRLLVMQDPQGANETVPFRLQPKLMMVDKLNRTVRTLGHGHQGQWYITVSIRNNTGDPDARLGGNTSARFIDGWANFTNLNISHNATDYVLEYNVTSPLQANFSAFSSVFEVKERILFFSLVSQPHDANETVPFGRPPVVEVRDAANGDLVTNTGWKGRKWICKASILNPHSYKGNLSAPNTAEFSAGVASLTNLSIDHEDKNYVLAIDSFTVPQSRYQFSIKTNPFDVKERVLALVIFQQPGNCNDTVPCGFQPILEVRDTATNTLAGNLGWRGRTWTIQATMALGAGNDVITGISHFQIPWTGRVEFSNLSFYDVASGYSMKFDVTVAPHSPTYSGMSVISDTFDVHPRQFYLFVATQAANANQSVTFGTQPVVEVRDVGTGKRATPLKTSWWIGATLLSNPKVGQSFLNGTRNVSVSRESAAFFDLFVTVYGIGYVLKFQSNFGQSVLSAPFEVHYVNDFSPVFVASSGNYTVSISEAVSIGSFVITISATDEDKGSQGDVFYALGDGNVGKSFHINRTSGDIVTAAKLDRETNEKFTITVRAYDGAVPEKVRFTEGLVLVNILDVNDNAPRFTHNPFTSTVNETAGRDEAISRVEAVDHDSGTNAELRFSITSGNDDGYFDIRPTTGEIVVKRSLDLEDYSPPPLSNSLGVHVTDLGSPTALSNSTNVTILILPVNEFPPQLTHEHSARVSIVENQEVGSGLVLFDINATDKDFGEQGQVSYSVHSGSDAGKFIVNVSTGVVTLATPLDYEDVSTYALTIRAADSDRSGHVRHVDFTLHVDVIDVNDNSPNFTQKLFTLNLLETLAVGQTVMAIQAFDADSGTNSRLSYFIQSGNSGGFFSLDPDTGVLTTQKSLDLESAQVSNWNFTLVIMAKDHGKPQLSGNVTFVLKIAGVNEFTPRFTKPGLSLKIAENVAVGSMLYHVTAIDSDFGEDGLVRFQIAEGNEDKRFRIDSMNGEVYVHAPLDRETKPIYHLKIIASDSPVETANQRSSYVFLNITLSDVNDNKPVFEKGSYYAAVQETAGIGRDVITIHATDDDAGTNGQVRYKIISGNAQGFFDINTDTGMIYVKKNLDLESQQHVNDLLYTLTIEAWDGGSPIPLSNDVLVTIEIESVNEFPPQLLHSDSLYVKIPEDTAVGSRVTDINATDKDFGLDGRLTYSVMSGNEDNKFVINPDTGVITIKEELDYETVVRYSLGIRVSDDAQPDQRLSTFSKVTIRLTNINDSGGVDVLIQDVISRLTPSGDPAEYVGVRTTTPITVMLLYENGKFEKLSADDNRLTFDDTSESRGFFKVVVTQDKIMISANSVGLLGQGVLIVRVHNVYNVRVKISVVGFSFLCLQAAPYPSPDQSIITLTSLKRVGNDHGNFQEAELGLRLVLSDNSTYDVTTMVSASFEIVSYDAGVQLSLGPSPKNVLVADKNSGMGNVSVRGKFAGKSSNQLDIQVSSQVITVNEIVAVRLNELSNQTLMGLVLSTKRQVQVDFLMNDSSLLRIQNFSTFSGLVTFTSSHDQISPVDYVTGIVTLLGDYYALVSVTVTALQGAAEPKQVSFYCNTIPPVGGVDVGQEYGPALPPVQSQQRVTIPVRVNHGLSQLLAFDVKVFYVSNQAHFVDVKRKVAYSHSPGMVHLADVIDPDDPDPSHVADIEFDSLEDGILSIQASAGMMIDQRLGSIGNYVPSRKSCKSLPLGDVNADCVFDIQDAAEAMAYSLAKEKRFAGEFEQTLFKTTTEKMRKVMDFNTNGVVERSDPHLLARASLGLVQFVHDFRVSLPDHRNRSSDCGLGITVKLSTRIGDKTTESNTDVFFEFASGRKLLTSQLQNTTFETGEMVTVYNGHDGLWGGIIKAVNRNGVFKILSRKSKLHISNVGLSMIQITQTPSRSTAVVTPLFSYSHVPRFPASVRVTLAPHADLVVTDSGHSPQMTVNITESYAYCKDPLVTRTIMFIFQNDFSDVEGKENQFAKLFIVDITSRVLQTTVTHVRLASGSILVYFDVTTQRSRMNTTLLTLWDLTKSGLTINMGKTEFQLTNVMRVDGNDYHGADRTVEPVPNASSFPVGVVVPICIVVALAVVGVVVFFCLKKRVVQKKKRAPWTRMSKISLLNSRAGSPMSDVSGDTELVLITGLANEQSSHSDGKMSPTPKRPELHSLGEILKPQDNFAKRKLRKVESASSQVSVEAWSESGSPAGNRRQQQTPTVPVPPLVTDKGLRKSFSGSRLLTKQKSDSQLLPKQHSSTEGSPLNLTPQIPKRNQVAQKKKLMPWNSLSKLINSDSSEEERSSNGRVPRNKTRGFVKRSLSPQTSGSELMDKELTLFERAVLHKRLSPRDETSKHSSSSPSVDSSPAWSGYSTPKLAMSSRPPGFVGNLSDGDDITIEDESYTVRLPVNVMNTVGEGKAGRPFTKLGFVDFPSDALLSDLRAKLRRDFSTLQRGKEFLFQDVFMADVDPTDEGKILARSVYNLSVIIRIANCHEANQYFCLCGAVAHFQCSVCYKRGYCGRECQLRDWSHHKITCDPENASSV